MPVAPTGTPLPDALAEELEAAMRERAGLVFPASRRKSIDAAAWRVMRRAGIAMPETLIELVREDGPVFDELMAEVTIGESYFFREAAHFALLRETILPEFRVRRAGDQRIRIWSAGCATGEEAYSLALTVRDEGLPGTIVGTDISRARLAAARRGEYRRWSFRGVPDATIARDFEPATDDRFVLRGDVRRSVEFRYLNLAADTYPSMSTGVWGMDVILCRNVLIYFDRDTIAHVARSLLATLAEDGWLLLGATDPPLDQYIDCDVVSTKAGMAYRHARARSSVVRPHAQPPLPTPTAPHIEPAPASHRSIPTAERPQPPLPGSGTTPAIVSDQNQLADCAEDAYARRDYEQVVELLAPEVARACAPANKCVTLVRALANLGRLADAGRACAAALDRFPEDAELHYLHAVLINHAGQFAESARAARRAVYLDRSLIVARITLASALSKSGDAAGAIRAYASAERMLGALPANDIVRATDGEPAGRLLEMMRLQLKLLQPGSVA